ncbi:MAG: hypothetical protein LBQ12_10725 [Deltaproteobacteria bacterium]|nr:hypothetical protein [Deltaproteobacteria bacterium]
MQTKPRRAEVLTSSIRTVALPEPSAKQYTYTRWSPCQLNRFASDLQHPIKNDKSFAPAGITIPDPLEGARGPCGIGAGTFRGGAGAGGFSAGGAAASRARGASPEAGGAPSPRSGSGREGAGSSGGGPGPSGRQAESPSR